MNTVTAKPSLLDVLRGKFQKRRDDQINPLEDEFNRKKNIDWLSPSIVMSTISVLIFSVILVICTLWIGMALLSGYGTIALGMVVGVEILLSCGGILFFLVDVPRRNDEIERLHDHLDLLSNQIKSADNRVDEVVSVEQPKFTDDLVIAYAASSIKLEFPPERLKEILASYQVAVDMLSERLAHG